MQIKLIKKQTHKTKKNCAQVLLKNPLLTLGTFNLSLLWWKHEVGEHYTHWLLFISIR